MPREEYSITADDEMHATFYLGDRIRNRDLRFHDSDFYSSAERDFQTAVDKKTANARIAALNSWCKKYLSEADSGKLKGAVRKRRERWRRGDEQKTITISAKAHKVLTRISKRDNVTFSQALENYLGKALNSGRGTSKRRLER
jgi:macrodomain Ter protein organizer (MatP/YcbG family)